jgi:hypothetical protein
LIIAVVLLTDAAARTGIAVIRISVPVAGTPATVASLTAAVMLLTDAVGRPGIAVTGTSTAGFGPISRVMRQTPA